MHVFLILTAAILCSSASGISQSDSKANTMQTLHDWVSMGSIWGRPDMQPVSGSSLQLTEKRREKSSDGKTLIHYNFKVTEMPLQDTSTLEYWQVGGPISPFQKLAVGLHINKDGIIVCGPDMVCGDRKQPEYPLELSVPNALGEPQRYVLTSQKDQRKYVTGIAIPFPLRSKEGRCQLDVTRITPHGELLIVSGSGFPPDSSISFNGDSEGEKTHRSKNKWARRISIC